MFGISFSEVVLILILALIIFGPTQLPEIAKKIGELIYKMRTYFYTLKAELGEHSTLNDIKHARAEIFAVYQNIKQNLRHSPNSAIIDEEPSHLAHDYIHFNDDEAFLYQPELEFDRQPELFDEY
jgi:sec-independent protein translocase protein TatB